MTTFPGLAVILAAALALIVLAFVLAWLKRLVGRHGTATVLYRFVSGQALDGVHRTNATFTMPARGDRPVLHPTGHARKWHHRPGWHRAAIRLGATFGTIMVAAGIIIVPLVTGILLAILAAAGITHQTYRAARWLRRYRHYRQWERPTHRSITKEIGATPAKLQITYNDDKRPIGAVIGFGEEYTPDDRSKEKLTRAITTKLALEAPTPDWSKLHGRKPEVTFRPCDQPPPRNVAWAGPIAAAVEAAAPNALVFGIGVKGAIIKATYGEAAHIAIPGISGGGKSNLAACLLLQELMRGSLIFNLDPKWHSHLWMQGLPNVINAHEILHLHMALEWLGRELDRRNRAAYASANGTGRIHGSVGPRIIVVAEELNFGMPGLKNYWHEVRTKEDPKKSPALQGLSDLSCAGRAVDMHEMLIAQMLTADSTGAKDSTIRGNAGVKAMINPDGPGWNMVVGKHIPMPPQTTIPGRIQLVTGQTVRACQVPYLHLVPEDEDDPKECAIADQAVRWARELAVSGAVAKIPIGGEYGVPLKLVPACVLGETVDRPSIEAGQGPGVVTTGTVIEAEVVSEPLKLSTMIERGLIPGMTLDALRKASLRWDDFPEVAGREGPANTYNPDEVIECVQSHRQALRVVS